MNNCKNCKHAIFDPQWGDYKCEIDKLIHMSDRGTDCENWAEGEPRLTKDVDKND